MANTNEKRQAKEISKASGGTLSHAQVLNILRKNRGSERTLSSKSIVAGNPVQDLLNVSPLCVVTIGDVDGMYFGVWFYVGGRELGIYLDTDYYNDETGEEVPQYRACLTVDQGLDYETLYFGSSTEAGVSSDDWDWMTDIHMGMVELQKDLGTQRFNELWLETRK